MKKSMKIRNGVYRIICTLRRRYRFRSGHISEAVYLMADNLKTAMDEKAVDDMFSGRFIAYNDPIHYILDDCDTDECYEQITLDELLH